MVFLILASALRSNSWVIPLITGADVLLAGKKVLLSLLVSL